MKNKILVIEDNEQNLYLVTFILEKHGYQVIQALDGVNGMELAKKTSPDLILLDIQLPGMDGYAVAKMLKKIKDLENVPIIAVTSYAMVGDREKALKSGCTGYIKKPINPDTFLSEIEQRLPKQASKKDNSK